MLGKSHTALGSYLAERYMPHLSAAHYKAFLLGCIQPDRNPATYLKGSVRHQWLRGHNYGNARRFMQRISKRLESRNQLNIYDYYTLGKLIHYTADSFTYAHNAAFAKPLSLHRAYESELQSHFLRYIASDPSVEICHQQTIIDGIIHCHRRYFQGSPSVHRDCRFALQACCCVLSFLFLPTTLNSRGIPEVHLK